MRKFKREYQIRPLLAALAVVGLALGASAIAPSASARGLFHNRSVGASQKVTAVPMLTGARTPTPVGLISFCAAKPGECGLSSDANLESRRRNLMETYYWRVALNAGSERDWTRPIQVASLGPVSLPYMPPRGAERQPIALDAENAQLLASVNARINEAIMFVPSQDRNGPPAWRMPIAEAGGGRAYGDCKDYVLEKRRALLAAGVPEAALTIALVENNQRQGHAVLLVDTDRGELVLDSADSRILPWNKARYHWVSRQVRGELLQWVNIPQRYS